MSYKAQIVTLLTAAALATFAAFSSGRAADQTPKLLTEHFMIDAVDPGTKLYIRNKRPEGMTQFSAQKTLLFVHGATLPGEVTFDFPGKRLILEDFLSKPPPPVPTGHPAIP